MLCFSPHGVKGLFGLLAEYSPQGNGFEVGFIAYMEHRFFFSVEGVAGVGHNRGDALRFDDVGLACGFEHEVNPLFGQVFGHALGAGAEVPGVDPGSSTFGRSRQTPVAAFQVGLLGGETPGGGQAEEAVPY